MAEKGVRWAFSGLYFFKDDPVDRQLFFGREIEIEDLSETILAENVTVLFGKSGGDKGMRKLLSRFYRDITRKFKLLRLGSGPRKLKGLFGLLRRFQPVHSPRLAVRHLCEDRLITAGGKRNSRHEDEIIREVGVSKADLQQLVDSRLLRREPRLQEAFYELSHDSLVPSLQTAGGVRKGWVMSFNLTFIAVLIFASLQWGLPYLQSYITIKNLNAELEALKGQEITVEMFKLQLSKAERTVGESAKIAGIRERYNDWRKTSLQRKVDEVRQRYDNFVHLPGVVPTENNYKTAKLLLDSAYVALDKDVRITELQLDLAKLRGSEEEQKPLEIEAKRQRDIGSRQLLAAIQIKEPANMILKAYSSTRETQAKIVLKNSKILQSARVFLNDAEMSSLVVGKETFKTTVITFAGKGLSGRKPFDKRTVTVLPDAQKVSVTVKAIDKEGNQVSKDLTFKIDRMPLRRTPIENLTVEELRNMIKKYDFYSTDRYDWAREWSNPKGKGIANDFSVQGKDLVVLDHTTGLIWQQSGSLDYMAFAEAQKYIDNLNNKRFAGYSDWRLPTLEEAMTLMEPKQKSGDLNIDPIFDQKQRWIWTSDKYSASRAWYVHFNFGNCYDDYYIDFTNRFVRAVR